MSGTPGEQVTGAAPVYRERRRRIAARLGEGAALVVHSGELRERTHDTHYRFRPDSNFHYLTGLAEPGALLVLRPGKDPETVLFVLPRDPEAEVWNGRRIGPEGAKARYGADEAYPVAELAAQLPKLLDGVETVHAPLSSSAQPTPPLLAAIEHLRKRNRYGEAPPECLRDVRVVLGEDRIVKDEAALHSLRRAIDISARAHTAAMRHTRPGLREYEIEALIEYHFRREGSSGPGYGTIVGAGDNATILHYVDNSGLLSDGQLLLVDAGAEWDLFSGDITRTYPVSGKFSPAQRELYAVVLAANQAGIDRAVVGSSIDAIHDTCLRTLCEGQRAQGLAEGSVDEMVAGEKYKKYYMHRTSHWLGADVHDAGYYCLGRKSRPLQPGFVLTIEPGLYIAASDESAPAELRGCGVRVEDDVLITEAGPEVLTASVPKRPEELEDIVGTLARA